MACQSHLMPIIGEADLFSPFADDVPLHPFALGSIILGGASLLILPKRYASIPIFIIACFIAQGQRINVGVNFNILRIMVLFAWIRLITRSELRGIRFVSLDKAVLLLCCIRTCLYTCAWGESGALIYQLGQTFDALGVYFLFRALIRNWDDFDAVVRNIIFVSIPTAAAFMLERATGRNVFAVFGGVPAITVARDGKLRCQGAFPHPIIAGTFWASWLPLLIGRIWNTKLNYLYTIVGLCACLFIIFAAWSSTPLGGVLAAVAALSLYPIRYHMRAFRWGFLVVLCVLHFFIMNGPVWSILGHIDITGGSTGAYRSVLIDETINNFGGWWLCGVKSVNLIQGWNPYYYDITNQYVLEGVTAGLATMLSLVAVISLAFSSVGKCLRLASSTKEMFGVWCMGGALVAHVFMFFGVSYFGQAILAWYVLLAAIASVHETHVASNVRVVGARVNSGRLSRAALA